MLQVTVNKAGKTWDVDFDTLPDVSKAYVIEYGLRQVLNDAVSQGKNPKDYSGAEAAKHTADNAALVQRKVDGLVKGELRIQRQSTADPVEREARRIAIDLVQYHPKFKSWMAENKLKVTDEKARDKLAELVKAKAATDAVVTEAKKRVKAAEAMAGDLDI